MYQLSSKAFKTLLILRMKAQHRKAVALYYSHFTDTGLETMRIKWFVSTQTMETLLGMFLEAVGGKGPEKSFKNYFLQILCSEQQFPFKATEPV